MSASFERISSEVQYRGRIITVTEDRFRYEDGAEADREIVLHPGAVGVVAHDDEFVYLVRQPRETVGAPDLLELPAGKLDEEGETPEQTGRRELAEEIGKAARTWEHLHSFYSSVGISNEEVHVFLATGLSDVPQPDVEEDERIDLVAWPLADLEAAIEETADAKTLIGLLELQRRRRADSS